MSKAIAATAERILAEDGTFYSEKSNPSKHKVEVTKALAASKMLRLKDIEAEHLEIKADNKAMRVKVADLENTNANLIESNRRLRAEVETFKLSQAATAEVVVKADAKVDMEGLEEHVDNALEGNIEKEDKKGLFGKRK